MIAHSPSHDEHNHWDWPKTWPEKWAFIMGILASVSLGIVACIAFYTVLGWGGWPLAIVTGFAALFTESVVYLTDMPSEFRKYCHHGLDRDLKNNYMAEYLLLTVGTRYGDKKTLTEKIDRYIENKRVKESDIKQNKNFGKESANYSENKRVEESCLKESTDPDEAAIFNGAAIFFRYPIPSYLCLIYNGGDRYARGHNSLLFSFHRKKILFYIALLFALGSGICFGVVGFTHATIACTFLFGFAAAAMPAWVIALASVTAFAAAFTYTMLMASSLNKLFNGGFEKFWISIKNIFICPRNENIGWHIFKAFWQCVLLVGVAAAVVLVGLASGGMLMDAATNVFVATAQLAAPLVDFIATVVTWILWIPLMVLFLLYNSWRSLQAIWMFLGKLANPVEREQMKKRFLENLPKDKRLIPFFILGFLVASFFFALHVVSEGALAGEGAKGESDIFSNVFLRFSEGITFLFKKMFAVTLIVPAVMVAVVLSTVVEVLEDLPYFASSEEDAEEAHDHHTFIIEIFGATGGAIINFFSHNGLPKLLGLACLGMGAELLFSTSVAWISQSAFWGMSAVMAPSMFAFSILLLAAFVGVIYLNLRISKEISLPRVGENNHRLQRENHTFSGSLNVQRRSSSYSDLRSTTNSPTPSNSDTNVHAHPQIKQR